MSMPFARRTPTGDLGTCPGQIVTGRPIFAPEARTAGRLTARLGSSDRRLTRQCVGNLLVPRGRFRQENMAKGCHRVSAHMLRIERARGTRLEYAYSKTLYGANSESQWEKSLRVCTTRYFDFYFHLVVPEGGVPVADIETTLESTRDQNEMVQNLIRYVNTGRLRPALETLRARLKSIPAERLVNVLGALLEIGDRARHRAA